MGTPDIADVTRTRCVRAATYRPYNKIAYAQKCAKWRLLSYSCAVSSSYIKCVCLSENSRCSNAVSVHFQSYAVQFVSMRFRSRGAVRVDAFPVCVLVVSVPYRTPRYLYFGRLLSAATIAAVTRTRVSFSVTTHGTPWHRAWA